MPLKFLFVEARVPSRVYYEVGGSKLSRNSLNVGFIDVYCMRWACEYRGDCPLCGESLLGPLNRKGHEIFRVS